MTSQQRADEIIKLITDTVRPELWRVNGGNCTISFMRGNLVVDGRNVFDPARVRDAGLEYEGVGRSARPRVRVRV